MIAVSNKYERQRQRREAADVYFAAEKRAKRDGANADQAAEQASKAYNKHRDQEIRRGRWYQ